MDPVRFADPGLLALLLLPAGITIAALLRRRHPPPARLAFPALHLLDGAPASYRSRWRRLPEVLTIGGLALLVLGLARPEASSGVEEVRLRSRNLVIALDISSSMKATDFQPGNRVSVAREIVRDFVRRRDGDLIGLVIFAGRAFLQAPLTPDLSVLDRLLERVDIGLLPDGTAIGTALTLAVTQLRDLPHKASAIVLITDGANNTGTPSPAEAAEVARALGIRVHVIGLSSPDTSQIALNGVWTVRRLAARLSGRDEEGLKRIAARTGGQYYRADDPAALRRIMAEIDPMERIEVPVHETRRYRELFPWVVGAGLALLLLERLLRATWLRPVPW